MLVVDRITTAEAARLLDRTPATIRNWLDRGVLTGIRSPGGTCRIDRSSVQELLEEREGRVTAGEAAKQMGFSPAAVRQWLEKGDLTGIRYPSGAVLIDQSSIDEWLGLTPQEGTA